MAKKFLRNGGTTGAWRLFLSYRVDRALSGGISVVQVCCSIPDLTGLEGRPFLEEFGGSGVPFNVVE